MDLWRLKIFCTVVELRSFSLAAERVHISQPTVSSHIKDLESHFGIRLIDRTVKEAVPTKAGLLLYEYAGKLLSLRTQTEAALAEFQGRVKGTLEIGGSTIPGVYILPRIMSAFMAHYPEVKFSLKIGDTEEMITQILQETIEIGVVGARTGDKRVAQRQLVEDEMRLVAPADHKWAGRPSISMDMLIGEPLIIREPGSGTLSSLKRNLSAAGESLDRFNVAAEMGSTAAVIQGIKCGIGVSFLSMSAVSEDVESGRLAMLKVDEFTLKRCFYLTRLANRTLSPLCETFVKFLTDSAALWNGGHSEKNRHSI